MKNILIIGGDSYIGANFIRKYSNEYNIKSFSRLQTGFEHETVVNGFLSIKIDVFKAIDCVINFAAIVHQPHLQDKNLYYQVNTELPHNLAAKAKEAGVKHFIQLSTIAVYENTGRISSKTAELPNTIYGKSKLKGDRLLLGMKDESFDVSIVRPPMVYGGGASPGNMMRLVKIAQKGIPLPFKGVDNRKDFIHVNNLTDAIHCIILNEIFGVVIPTDKQTVSTYDILKIVQQHSKNVRLFHCPKVFLKIIKYFFPNLFLKLFATLLVDCSLPSAIYQPKYSIEEGISEMLSATKN